MFDRGFEFWVGILPRRGNLFVSPHGSPATTSNVWVESTCPLRHAPMLVSAYRACCPHYVPAYCARRAHPGRPHRPTLCMPVHPSLSLAHHPSLLARGCLVPSLPCTCPSTLLPATQSPTALDAHAVRLPRRSHHVHVYPRYCAQCPRQLSAYRTRCPGRVPAHSRAHPRCPAAHCAVCLPCSSSAPSAHQCWPLSPAVLIPLTLVSTRLPTYLVAHSTFHMPAHAAALGAHAKCLHTALIGHAAYTSIVVVAHHVPVLVIRALVAHWAALFITR
ncbi:hypothetical protein BDW22DRAFT_883350 [Trametopsis cervina]|nr:hypothetical protein BDW22DRAFT_883350 [Trametopsis cervina]